MSDAPAILVFLGPEEGQRAEEIAGVRARIAKASGADPDEHRIYLPDGSVDEAVSILRNGSLFASHRLVLVYGAELIKTKTETTLIADYVSAPPGDSTLVLISENIKLDRALQKVVPASAKKIFWELFENQKIGWVTSYFRKRGVEIEPEAVELVLELVENNTQELRVEAEKLCVFVGSEGTVTTETVETYLYHSREESVFSLFKCIVKDDFAAALEVLQTLVASGDVAPVQIVAGLVFQVRKLLSFRQLLDNGFSGDAALAKLFIRGKRIQADYRAGATRFNSKDLTRQLYLLSEYDSALRTIRPGLHRCLLDLLVYQLLYRSTDFISADMEGAVSA